MSNFSGRKVVYGIARETARGTAVNPAYWLGWMDADMHDSGKTETVKSAINELEEASGAAVVETMGAGKIGGLMTDQSFGDILYALFGSHSSAAHAGETIVFDHTFSESQTNAAASMTLTRKDPNVTNQFALAMLKSLELDVVAGDFVKYASDWVSQPSATATVTPAFVAENTFIAKNVILKLANTVGGLGAATAILAKSVKLTIDKAVDPYFIIGQTNPTDIFSKKVTIKGDFVMLYSDDTYKTLRFNNTPQAVLIDIKNTGVTLGTGTNPELAITLPQVYLTDWKLTQALDGMVEQTVTLEGTFSIGSGYGMQAVLTNLVNNAGY